MLSLLNYVQDRGADYIATLRAMTLDGSAIAETEGEQQLAMLSNACPRVVAWLNNKDGTLPQYAEINSPIKRYEIA